MKKFLIALVNKLVSLYHWTTIRVIWPLSFVIGSVMPVNKKLVLFAMNMHYNDISDNMQSIYDCLKERGYDCRKIIDPKKKSSRFFYQIKFQLLYARSAYVFVSDNYDPLYAHKPRKGSRVIQLWHGCGAFKKWGYSTLDLAWGGKDNLYFRFPRHNTYTDVFISSESVIPCYAEAFNCSKDIIKPLGTPRTDVFYNKDFVNGAKDKFLKRFPEIGDRKIILYAPTFRGESPDLGYNDSVLDLVAMKENFSDEYALVLKLHPFVGTKISFTEKKQEALDGFVFNASVGVPIDEALCAADILIADYSSLIFEYALLDKPALFFAYDLDNYSETRGFYYEYNDFVPGKIVKTNDEIIEAIKSRDFEQKKMLPFRQKFMSACDGHSTERIINYLFKD